MSIPPPRAEIPPGHLDADLGRFPLEGGLVLHRRSQARYWLLNTSGAALFEGLEQGEPIHMIAERLAGQSRIPPDEAKRMLDQTVRAWTDSGLFLAPETPVAEPVQAPLPNPDAVRFDHVVLNGKHLALGLDDQTLAQVIRGLLFPWLLDAGNGAAPSGDLDAHLLVNRTQTGLALFHNGVLVEQDPCVEIIETALLRTVHNFVYQPGSLGAIFHAGVVVRGGGALLLPGVTHAGKSTLTLALALSGFSLLGDDFAFFERDSGNVSSPQTAAKLRNPEPLARSSRGFDLDRLIHAPEHGFVHLPDAAASAMERAKGFPMRAICFPSRGTGRRPALVRLSPLECVARLIESSSWFDPEPVAMRRTLDHIAAIPAYALEYDRIDEALDLVAEANLFG